MNTRGLALLMGLMSLATVAQAQIVNPREHTVFRCLVNASTATTLTAMGGECVAPGAAVSLYITEMVAGASAAGGVGADTVMTLKYGTGGTCGTGTTTIWAATQPAGGTVSSELHAPIKVPHNNELCWINSTVGTKWLVIGGYKER